MNRIALVMLFLGLALSAFGWWGTRTVAGRRRYDEMAGMIPVFVGWAGWALVGLAVVWIAVAFLRSRG